MQVLVDSNIALDLILHREGLFDESFKAINRLYRNGATLSFSASSITDIYYIVNKLEGSEKAKEVIIEMNNFFDIVEVDESCTIGALISNISDYEDAVIEMIAQKNNIDFILTRNIKDFKESKILVKSPKDILA